MPLAHTSEIQTQVIGRGKQLDQACKWIEEADCILIAAGAGMSVEAGIDYTDTKKFKSLFPHLARQGFTCRYDLTGYDAWRPETKWGYIALSAYCDLFENEGHLVYEQLLHVVGQKDYFVITSNVDGLFYQNHFRADKVFTPQGNISQLQCLTPCTQQTWNLQPYLNKMVDVIDPCLQTITDMATVPNCPKCGGELALNVRGGYWFAEAIYKQQERIYRKWLRKARQKKLLIIELGAGFNTPSVIRWPMERLVADYKNTRLIRVNLKYPDVPTSLWAKSLSVNGEIGNFLQAIVNK